MSEQVQILFQDAWIVAINKPAGLLVHRSPVDRSETRFALQLLRDSRRPAIIVGHGARFAGTSVVHSRKQ